MSGIFFEKGAYVGWTAEKIAEILRSQGYHPALIKEQANDSLAPHKHPESHILVQVGGDMTITSGEQTFQMVPGDKLTIPPNAEHAAHFGEQGSEYLWVEY